MNNVKGEIIQTASGSIIPKMLFDLVVFEANKQVDDGEHEYDCQDDAFEHGHANGCTSLARQVAQLLGIKI